MLARPLVFLARQLALVTTSVLAISVPAAAQTDSYPNKPITLVVAYPPGGSTDLTGRTLGVELSKKLGVTVIIDNVSGAGGAIGAQKVVNAAPDGYTLLVGASNEIAITGLVSSAVKYKVKDFTPWA
jgi:tripartite-type tricarboxylate transporter receptor subunit TctC